MARAMLEAVAFDLRTIVGVMRKKLTLAEHVVLTGGLARSPIIPQLLADVLDAEIQVPADGEGSIAGAAILALNGLGAISALSFIARGAHGEDIPSRRRESRTLPTRFTPATPASSISCEKSISMKGTCCEGSGDLQVIRPRCARCA